MTTTIFLQLTGTVNVGIVASLSTKPRTNAPNQISEKGTGNWNEFISIHHDSRFSDRRTAIESGLFGIAAAVLFPGIASAGIDVSSLKVEANPLDVFMGGTYYEDDGPERDGMDGRISRRKYTIVEAGTSSGMKLAPSSNKKKVDFFEGLENRPIKVLGESTSISSSRDDPLELDGNLFLCNERGSKGCISIDFSPIGGKVSTGFWDEGETGIRFEDSGKVWSKQ